MKIILFTNARDETHIKEWVAHHLNLGFDFIHIFDHKSKQPINKLFKPNPKLRIQRIDYSTTSFKTTLMMKAKEISVKETYDWMLYLDADEFLVLNNYTTVHELMYTFNKFNQVGINWIMFGSNYLDKEPDGMILENYTRCKRKMENEMKTFVKPNSIIDCVNPHFYITNNMNLSINGITRMKLNRDNPALYPLSNKSHTNVPVYIAHYVYQSYDVYISRKVNLPRDDGNCNVYRPVICKEIIHVRCNDIINIEVRDKYSEKNAELIKTL